MRCGAQWNTGRILRPLFISPGHKIDLDGAITIALGCSGRYRIPEPIRCADMLSKKLKARE